MLSGIPDEEEKKRLASQLESLGARVSENQNYDPESTHLICVKPSRNEKTLACIAAGKWILHVSYVDESVKAGKLLDVMHRLLRFFSFTNFFMDTYLAKF